MVKYFQGLVSKQSAPNIWNPPGYENSKITPHSGGIDYAGATPWPACLLYDGGRHAAYAAPDTRD